MQIGKYKILLISMFLLSSFFLLKKQVQRISRNLINKIDDKYEVYSYLGAYLRLEVCQFMQGKGAGSFTKQAFENYLQDKEGNQLISILQRFEYSIIEDKNGLVYFYDWGLDGKDDKLQDFYYYTDSIAIDKQGDLLVFAVERVICNTVYRKKQADDILVASGNKNYDDKLNIIIKKKINRIIRDFKVRLRPSQDDLYLPKEGAKTKESLLSLVKETEKVWTCHLIEIEHCMDDIDLLVQDFLNFVSTDEQVFSYEIYEILIPIRYYENDQMNLF